MGTGRTEGSGKGKWR